MSKTPNTAIPPQDAEMSLVQHLLHLKTAISRAVIAIIVLFICLFPFANEIYVYISAPLTQYLPAGTSMIATGVASPFLTPFKLSLVLAIYMAMPFMFYQIWTFIAPALYKHEKQLVAPLLFFSSFLFYAGGLFAFYVVFPLVFGFLTTAAPDGVTIATDIALYLDFVIKMFFAFGIAFEVPIVVVLLILTKMSTPAKLSHSRPYVIVGAFIVGMLLTPPDIISQTLLAIPIWLLFEAGIIVGGIVLKARTASAKIRNKDEEDDDGDDTPTPPTPNSSSNKAKTAAAATAGTVATSAVADASTEQTKSSAALDDGIEREEDEYDDDYDPYEVDDHQENFDSNEFANNPQNIADNELDTRYEDQLVDDKDWDEEFDKMDSEFGALDRAYQEQLDGEKTNDKDASETPLEAKTDEENKTTAIKTPEEQQNPSESDAQPSDKKA